MKIQENKVVTIDYVLNDKDGNLIDSSNGDHLAFIYGSGQIIPGLEAAMLDKVKDEELNVELTPDQAYGERDESLVKTIAKDIIAGPDSDDIQVGMQFETEDQDGNVMLLTAIEVKEKEVTLDGNHPLAGIDLHFTVRIIDVRDATSEELAHGHVHGPGGHHH